MTTTFGPDHLCQTCHDVRVYYWFDNSGHRRLMEVDRARPHLCLAATAPQRITGTRCSRCGLHVFVRDGALYEEDAALVRHQCEVSAPEPVQAGVEAGAIQPQRRPPSPPVSIPAIPTYNGIPNEVPSL